MEVTIINRTETESEIENNSKLRKTRYFKRSILPSRIIVFETSTFSIFLHKFDSPLAATKFRILKMHF